MTIALLFALSLGIASAQPPEVKSPIATAKEVTEDAPAEAPLAETAPATNTKKNGTRPIPKTGVKEAKEVCKRDGHKGRALSTCIQSKTISE